MNRSVTFAPAFCDSSRRLRLWSTALPLVLSLLAPVSLIAQPSAVSVSPSSGTGLTQTFALVYSDAGGWGNLQNVQVIFNSTLNGFNACYVQYDVAGNWLALDGDNNNWGNALSLGSGGTAQNSQCTVDATHSSASGSGNNLTLNLAVTFNSSFAGTKNAYLLAVENGGTTSQWLTAGTWTVGNPPVPSVVSSTPSSGTGLTQTFTLVYSDTAGWASLNNLQVNFSSPLSGANACYVGWNPAGVVYLLNDAGNTFLGPVTLGSAGSVSNSQCTVNGAGSSTSGSGNNMTLTLALTFSASFAGTQNIYMFASDSGSATGWVTAGTWTVGTPSVPSAVSVAPSSGGGLTQTFTMVYSDTAGWANLQNVQVIFNSTLNGSNACYVQYNVAGNWLALDGDNNNWGSALTLGSGGTAQNSQCSVNAAASSSSGSGTNLTLNLAITFFPSFAGTKNMYLLAIDNGGITSQWLTAGTWGVPAPVISSTVTSTPGGLSLTVDGIPCTTPCPVQWTQGSPHTVAVTTPQAGAAGTQYAFSGWSDGGAASHSITGPASSTTYITSFATQYLLTTALNPTTAGTISPASAFFNSGASVAVGATANSGAHFTGFAGALSTAATPQNLTMNGPASVTANFTLTPDFTVSFNSTESLSPLSINPGGGSFVPIVVGAVGGFTSPVTLSVSSGAPSSYFFFTTGTFIANGSGFATLQVAVPGSAPPNQQYLVTVTGTSGSVSHSQQFTLSVTGPPPRFSVGVSPGSQTVAAGSTVSYSVTVNSFSGFSGTIGLSASGLPAGWGASFNPASVVTQGTSTLTVTTPSNASGTNPFMVTGAVSGGPSVSTSVTLVVNAGGGPPLQTITTSPPGLSVTVDGVGCVAPCKFQWVAQTNHTIGTAATQAGAANTQYLFSSWPDGGTISHTVTAQSVAVTYTANFTTQYFLTTAVSQAGLGNIGPASGWHNSGEVVTVSASPTGVQPFTGFGGDLNGTATPQNVSMTAPRSVTASFGQDFVLSQVPDQTVMPGQGVNGIPLTITSLGGFSSSVNLSFTSVPQGLTATFTPSSATSSTSITISASAGMLGGVYPLNFIGQDSAGVISHMASLNVAIPSRLASTDGFYVYNDDVPIKFNEGGVCGGFDCTTVTCSVVRQGNLDSTVTVTPVDQTPSTWAALVQAHIGAPTGVNTRTVNCVGKYPSGRLAMFMPALLSVYDINTPVKLIQFGWGNNQELWKTTTFASNGDSVIGPIVWQDPNGDGNVTINEPAALIAGRDLAYLSNIVLRTDPSISSVAELQVVVSPADFSFRTLKFKFENGQATIPNLNLSAALPNVIKNATYQFAWNIRYGDDAAFRSFRAPTTHQLYTMHQSIDNNTAEYRITTKRLDYVTTLLGQGQSDLGGIIEQLRNDLLGGRFSFSGLIGIATPNNIWELQQLGYTTANVNKAYPTGAAPPGDTNATSQETLPNPPDGMTYYLTFRGNFFEGFISLSQPDTPGPMAVTIAPASPDPFLGFTNCVVSPASTDNLIAFRVLTSTYADPQWDPPITFLTWMTQTNDPRVFNELPDQIPLPTNGCQ
jgi:hypothetical protein